MSHYTLENKRVVIIGGSSGIGLATAIQAAEAGADVIIAGRSASRLEEAREQIAKVVGEGASEGTVVEVHVLDNQNEQQLEAFFARIGRFDHLFTPGAAYTRGPLTSDRETAESCFKGKFWPQYFAAKYAAPSLGFRFDHVNVWWIQPATTGWRRLLRRM